jgi:hypothetical protein
MACTFRLGLLLATVQIAHGSRLSGLDLLLTDSDVAEDNKRDDDDPLALEKDEDIDFSFMTDDFRYPGRETTGFLGTITEWFGGRSTGDDRKDELVEGHACQKRGSREETYYATSLCYWLPEISSESQSYPVLAWKGGKYSKAKSLCRGMTGSGVCAKCSVCHNNARDVDGDVEHERFYEHLTLPDGCFGEKQIERLCVDEYTDGNQALKMEDSRCHEVEGRFDQAAQELARCTSALERLPVRVNQELPQELQRAQQNILQKEEQSRSAEDDERASRRWVHGQCRPFSQLKHGLGWHHMLLGATPTEQLLDNMMIFFCTWPIRPVQAAGGEWRGKMQRYNNQMREYNACNKCHNAKSQLRSANSRTKKARSGLRSAQGQLTRLQQEMSKAQQDLAMWQSRHSALSAAKEALDSEWLPQADACQETYSHYTNGLNLHVSQCAPTYYNASCEKACIEVQAQHAGCGVLEGDRPGSVNSKGGIEGTCAPPQPSWVMGPFTYGAKEATDDQCKRIEKVQSVRHAQKIVKSGWLWKKGRGINGWDKRFFVLESGDQVRSAVLRYFKEDPSTRADSDESAGKGIILWDAKGLKVKSGDHYGWKDGEECFKLYHFYRDFKLCVPSDDSDSVVKIRDEWMDLLDVEMTHSKES